MNMFSKFAAGVAVVLLSGGMAFADCVDTTASTTPDGMKTPPIAKDGSTAPLEQEAAKSDQQQAGAEPTQKDGGNMPLAQSEGDQSEENLATSQQDVEAQQEGEQTAAAKADDAC